jgi:hypothetical protein
MPTVSSVCLALAVQASADLDASRRPKDEKFPIAISDFHPSVGMFMGAVTGTRGAENEHWSN